MTTERFLSSILISILTINYCQLYFHQHKSRILAALGHIIRKIPRGYCREYVSLVNLN